MVEESTERRRHPRIGVKARAIVYASERQLDCVAYNLSEGGCLILPPARARAGLPLRVNIGIPGLPEWIAANAVLMRECEYQGHYAWAIKFVQITPHAGTLLRGYIRRTLRGEPEPQMSAAARPLVAAEATQREATQGENANSRGAATPATTAQARGMDATGPLPADSQPLQPLQRRQTASVHPVTRRPARPIRQTRPEKPVQVPDPEPAPHAEAEAQSSEYTDPFADLPTAGASDKQLRDVDEAGQVGAHQSGEIEVDLEKASANVDLAKLYKAAVDDVMPKNEKKKKKGWFR